MKPTGYSKARGTLTSRCACVQLSFRANHDSLFIIWQLKRIFQELPKKKQVLLFSATITDTLKKLQNVALNDVSCLSIIDTSVDSNVWFNLAAIHVWSGRRVSDCGCSRSAISADPVRRQRRLPGAHRTSVPLGETKRIHHHLHRHLQVRSIDSVTIYPLLIKCNELIRCRSCQILCMTLGELGFESLALHSMTSQRERITALNRFRSNTVRILVATDVASRGLKIHSKSESMALIIIWFFFWWLVDRTWYPFGGVGGQPQLPDGGQRVRPPCRTHGPCRKGRSLADDDFTSRHQIAARHRRSHRQRAQGIRHHR